MSWIDDEEAKRQRSASEKQEKDKRELHRASLLDAKGREHWDELREECRDKVKEYEQKCGEEPRCKVRFDAETPERLFIVAHEYVDATRAHVTLQLEGYKIEVKHITFRPGVPEPVTSKWYLTFDCDGLEFSLNHNGKSITISEAAKQILKPVLY